MPRYNYRRRRYYRQSASRFGSERAREHIAAARRLTQELGGADEVVKRWLFSLAQSDLGNILTVYGRVYGASAQEYATKVIPRWQSGKVQMSGMVAERIFKLLPPFMPLELKYELTER